MIIFYWRKTLSREGSQGRSEERRRLWITSWFSALEGLGCSMLEEGLLQILEKVYKERGFDFRQYKESSLRRRIERRLRATKTVSYEEYLKVLDKVLVNIRSL